MTDDETVAAVLGDFRDHSGRGAASTGAVLYDIVRDAQEPITASELVNRWVAQASDAALGHVRRYAEHRRTMKSSRTAARARGSDDVADARVALHRTIDSMVRTGRLVRCDGQQNAVGLWDAEVTAGLPPLVRGEDGQVVAYDQTERARRQAAAAADRRRLRGASIAEALDRADAITTHRLAAYAHHHLAKELEAGADGRIAGARVLALVRQFAPNGERHEFELIIDEIARQHIQPQE